MKINVDNQEEWYSDTQFRAVFYVRDIPDVISAVQNILHCSYQTAYRRLRYGNFEHAETLEIARALNLTPREYCNCFLKGVFQEKGDI